MIMFKFGEVQTKNKISISNWFLPQFLNCPKQGVTPKKMFKVYLYFVHCGNKIL